MFFFTSMSFSQTTETEYNYITKGYQETISKGLDLKKGYSLQDLYFHNDEAYSFDFKLFVEDKTKKTKAIFVCAYSKVWQKKYYLCIPIANELLKKQYEDFLKTWDKQILTSYSVAFSEILTLSLTEAEKK